MPVIEQLASDDVLDRAYEWLCRRRRDYSPNSDVCAFRRCWPREKERIKGELLSGNYRFSLLSRCMLKDGEDTALVGPRCAGSESNGTGARPAPEPSSRAMAVSHFAPAVSPLEMYVRRWLRWARGGVAVVRRVLCARHA